MDENPTPQEGMSPEQEVAVEESTTEEETVEAPAEEVQEETVPKSQFNQVLARAKAAEAKLKANPTRSITQTQNVLTEEAVDTKILKAQGTTDAQITMLKKLAAVNKTSIIEAQNDDIFKAYKSKEEAEAKAEKAKLGASRGSGSVKKEKDLSSPGLSEAEHKERWLAQNGR